MADLLISHPPSPSGSPYAILLLRETEKEPAIGIENVIDIANAIENGIPAQSQHPSLNVSLVRLAIPSPNPAPTSPHASIDWNVNARNGGESEKPNGKHNSRRKRHGHSLNRVKIGTRGPMATRLSAVGRVPIGTRIDTATAHLSLNRRSELVSGKRLLTETEIVTEIEIEIETEKHHRSATETACELAATSLESSTEMAPLERRWKKSWNIFKIGGR
jgi:hypothetical protein